MTQRCSDVCPCLLDELDGLRPDALSKKKKTSVANGLLDQLEASPLPTPRRDQTKLSVWSSCRFQWSPPCSLCSDRGFGLDRVRRESAAGRICREATFRVSSNVVIWDMVLTLSIALDDRRLEMIMDDLLLFGGRQLAVDTTLIDVNHCDDTARRGADHSSLPRVDRSLPVVSVSVT